MHFGSQVTEILTLYRTLKSLLAIRNVAFYFVDTDLVLS